MVHALFSLSQSGQFSGCGSPRRASRSAVQQCLCATSHMSNLHLGDAHDFQILSNDLNNVAPRKRLSKPDLAQYCPLVDSFQIMFYQLRWDHCLVIEDTSAPLLLDVPGRVDYLLMSVGVLAIVPCPHHVTPPCFEPSIAVCWRCLQLCSYPWCESTPTPFLSRSIGLAYASPTPYVFCTTDIYLVSLTSMLYHPVRRPQLILEYEPPEHFTFVFHLCSPQVSPVVIHKGPCELDLICRL
jgi:hypothetical protein